MSNSLPVSEVFYSIQGEGKTMGQPSVFLRLAGCNLMCGGQGTQFDKELHNGATWRCDTIEVWLKGKSIMFQDILGEKEKNALENGARLIITGGEPLMNQNKIIDYIKYLYDTFKGDFYIEIETNGTIEPSLGLVELIDQWNISPKLQNSGNDLNIRYKPETLKAFKVLNSQYKFVVSNKRDIDEILEIKTDCNIPKEMICLMPAGENQEQLNITRPIVSEMAKQNYFNYSERLHIVIWNQKTGV